MGGLLTLTLPRQVMKSGPPPTDSHLLQSFISITQILKDQLKKIREAKFDRGREKNHIIQSRHLKFQEENKGDQVSLCLALKFHTCFIWPWVDLI